MARALRRLIVPLGFLLVFVIAPFIALGFGTGLFSEPVIRAAADSPDDTNDPHVWGAPD